jgi:hypothetical protein
MRRPLAVPPTPVRRSFADVPFKPGPKETDGGAEGSGERLVRALTLLLLLLLLLFLFGQL